MSPAQRIRWSITLVFFMHGFLGGSWVTRIPDLMGKLNINEVELGYLLLGSSLGVILTISFVGELISRYSAKQLIFFGSLTTSLLIILLAISPSFLLDWLVLFIFGASW